VLNHAYAAGASGYLAGRAIWSEAFKAYPDWNAVSAGLSGKGVDYMKDINALTDATAKPWWTNWNGVQLSNTTEGFRKAYADFGA
jgi:tagatose 1,6-diphosphate aldolase